MSLAAVSPLDEAAPSLEATAFAGPDEEQAVLFLRAVERRRCPADWRRPDGYWACVRRPGHHGRHAMRAALRPA
jgi:hypothetical protein